MPSWNPDVYERYKTYRDRPALDLMVQIPRDLDPAEIWDLGCGTGEHTAVLAARHLDANVHGLDSSREMLAKARARDAQVEWVEGDIAGFAPTVAPDLIFTNAALQWLPDHGRLFPRLAATLAPGGVFACQMPSASDAIHHQLVREVAAAGPWAKLAANARVISPTASLDSYYEWLSPVCGGIDLWTTSYLHVLEGDDPVLDWISGSGLRPYLDALEFEPDLKLGFVEAMGQRLSRAFPMRPDGVTLFPFKRLFMVARRGA